MADNENRECPFCKEDIKSSAIRCKHCGSAVQPVAKPHEGVCPYCKEEIKAEAIKCRHCKSALTGTGVGDHSGVIGCGCQSDGISKAKLDWADANSSDVFAMAAPGGGLGSNHDCYEDCKDAHDCANSNAPIGCKTKCFDRCYGSELTDAFDIGMVSTFGGNVESRASIPQTSNLPPIYETICRDVWVLVCTGTPNNLSCRWKKIGQTCTTRPIPTVANTVAY